MQVSWPGFVLLDAEFSSKDTVLKGHRFSSPWEAEKDGPLLSLNCEWLSDAEKEAGIFRSRVYSHRTVWIEFSFSCILA